MKLLIALCFFSVVAAQGGIDWGDIFEPTTPSTTSTTVSDTTTSTGRTAPKPCTRRTGEAGVCVRFSLCNSSNFSVITDGSGLIDIRAGTSRCPSGHICCLLPSRPTPSPATPTPSPSSPSPPPPRPATPAPTPATPAPTPATPAPTPATPAPTPATPAPTPATPAPTAPTPVQPTSCGQRNRDGVNSVKGNSDRDANFGEFPWMCAIMQFSFIRKSQQSEPEIPKPGGFLGGGSLIHPKVVLTTAHNVEGKTGLLVRAGEWDLHNMNEPFPAQERSVQKVITHKDYNTNTLYNDIAVLVLEKPMDLAAHIGVVCLPPPRARLPGGTRCFTSGWGTDKYGKDSRYNLMLKKLDLPVVEHSTCQTALQNTESLGYFFNLHSSFTCAGGEGGDADACVGDGGSPLVCPIPDKPDRYSQGGIVSWSTDCAKKGIPGVYVDVSNFRDWIDATVTSEGLDPKVYTA